MKTDRTQNIRHSVGTILRIHPKACLLAAFLAALMLLPASVQSATTWDNAVTSGSWNSAANWNNGAPSNSNAPAILNSSTNAISITNASGTFSSVGFSFQNTGAGSTSLQLGSNLTASRNASDVFFFNTGASSALAVDLNSYTFSFGNSTSSGILASRNYTIKDTSVAGNGVFSLANITRTVSSTTGTVMVENNTTVLITTRGSMDFRLINSATSVGWNFAPTATLKLGADGGAATNFNSGASVFGNVIVGDATNTVTALNYTLGSDTIIKSDLTLVNGSLLNFTTSGNQRLLVGGDFTDLATTGTDYGNSALSTDGVYFNGGGITVQEVNIARAGLSSNFWIGESASTAGSVLLKHDLATSGQVRVFQDSTLDAGNNTVTAGTMIIDSNVSDPATLAYTFGQSDGGLLGATGQLTLGTFNLKLTYDNSGWTNGDDLQLFSYGSLSGTPTLGSVTGLPGGWTYGSLFNDTINKSIWLTNVSSVPEPSTVGLFVGAIALLALRVRRNRRA